MQDMRLIRSFALGTMALLFAVPAAVRAQQQAPKGWIGVLITTGIGQSNQAGALEFNDYPVIESIDPGSPAEKAGLQAGDILISINSQDFRKNPIPLSSLLVPGRKVVFRYRRNDSERTSRMLVAERPAGTSSRVEVSLIGPAPVRERAEVEEGLNQRVNTRIAVPPMVSIAPFAFGTGTPSIAIAGAELTRLNDDLRDLVRVKGNGLFVVNVTIGSPAREAGLKSGDVIIRANREAVQNPGQLIRMITSAVDNKLVLEILRQQKSRTLTLRW
jgi:serine protease Do